VPKDLVDYSKQSQGNDEWAKLKDFRDPVNGRKLNSTGDWRPESQLGKGSVPKGLNKPGDSTA
jgi:hypothetical protein